MRHALTSSKAGLRSQHLGLQKALCALMGWKSADAHKDCWVREKLSNAETMALKEDLIIWPPVVIIHNSSITSNNQDQRVVVSAEELESQLRGQFPSFLCNVETDLCFYYSLRPILRDSVRLGTFHKMVRLLVVSDMP